jgi:hypothetical protein
MKILHLVLSHYWTLPFALALFARNRRTLAAVAAAAGPALVGFNLGGYARLATACVIALGIALSLALGRSMRAALAEMSPRARTRTVTALIAIGGIAVLPGSTARAFAALAHVATVKMRHWDARMPSRACLARRYRVIIAGAVYELPAAPVITVRTAGDSYHFQYASSLGRACARAAAEKSPIPATDMNLDFTIPTKGAFCHAATGPWAGQLCKGSSAQNAFPAMVNLYAPAEYDRERLMPPPTYGAFLDAQRKALASGHPFAPQPSGMFDRYANGYWVARAGWKNDAGEPYTLHCQATDAADRLSCETTYRLESGPEVTYRFTAPAHAPGTAAKSVEAGLHAMLEEFSPHKTSGARKPLAVTRR